MEGDYLHFTATYDGSYGLYKYGFKDGVLSKLSSGSYAADGVAFGDEVYFVGVGAKGERIYRDEMNLEEYPWPIEEYIAPVDFLSIDGVEERSAHLSNLSYLFKPYIRFPLLMGSDALGINSYYFNYIGDKCFNFTTKL